MCDVNRYFAFYKEMKDMEQEDTLQLILESNDEEQKMFFKLVGDFFIQQKQKKLIEENVF